LNFFSKNNLAFSLFFFYFISFLIFLVGFIALSLGKNNGFLLLIALEILFLAINFNFLFASVYLDDILGVLFVTFILAISGAEVATGLALYILMHKFKGYFLSNEFNNIKG
jgi:NADH-quinone oxidoreductase subunit K